MRSKLLSLWFKVLPYLNLGLPSLISYCTLNARVTYFSDYTIPASVSATMLQLEPLPRMVFLPKLLPNKTPIVKTPQSKCPLLNTASLTFWSTPESLIHSTNIYWTLIVYQAPYKCYRYNEPNKHGVYFHRASTYLTGLLWGLKKIKYAKHLNQGLPIHRHIQ